MGLSTEVVDSLTQSLQLWQSRGTFFKFFEIKTFDLLVITLSQYCTWCITPAIFIVYLVYHRIPGIPDYRSETNLFIPIRK